MRFEVILRPGEDGFVIAEVPALPGCYSQGVSREEALQSVREAIALDLETRREVGLPIPDPGSLRATEIAQVEVS